MNISKNEDDKLVVNGQVIPDGVVVVLGGDLDLESRVVTKRAVAMTGGLFEFAEMVNRPDSNINS